MTIYNKVAEIVKELCGLEVFCMESEFQKDFGFDSLQMVMLLMALEERFDIVLDESDMNPYDLVYVYQVVDMVKKYIKGDDDEEN